VFILFSSNPHGDLQMHRADALKPYLNAAHWIPLAINPYANLTAVFFTALKEEDVEDEDLTKPSEM
jgi:hypothetical protein